MKRESFERISQSFSSILSMYLDHSIYRVLFACSCKFEIAKFWHSKFHSNLWDYVASMQVWINQILTLKFVGFIGQTWKFGQTKFWHSKFHSNLWNYGQTCKFVKPCIDTQYSTDSNMYFFIKINILTFSILIQQLISNQNNIKGLIKQFN